jgi:hypothetical protein
VLALDVHNAPAAVALLNVLEREPYKFLSPQMTSAFSNPTFGRSASATSRPPKTVDTRVLR